MRLRIAFLACIRIFLIITWQPCSETTEANVTNKYVADVANKRGANVAGERGANVPNKHSANFARG